jgi:hypothetical protein
MFLKGRLKDGETRERADANLRVIMGSSRRRSRSRTST